MHLVREAELRVARQKELIAELKGKGTPADQAEALLTTFVRSLLEMQNHAAVLRELLGSAPDAG